jgi:anthranilate phosphoribosyltransferase
MNELLEYLYQHKTLSKAEAKEVLMDLARGKYNDYQIASFLTAFIMRTITLDELKGFREGMLSLCERIDLSEFKPMDLCGTGGDGKNTFNISTLSSFVVAGAGIPVAKHGNYGVSSVSGSSNVLEQLGIRFQRKPELLKKQLEEAQICFLHAPLFHPSMKAVAPVRKALGVKTFFNMLGPLVNPAQPTCQMTGVFNLELARMYQYILQEDNSNFTIVHALDGFDELSLTSEAKISTFSGEQQLNAAHFGFESTCLEDLFGGNTVEEAAVIFTNVLNGKGSVVQNNVVIANAALAIQTYRPSISLSLAVEKAHVSLFEGKAKNKFNRLKSIQ